ncbi:transmembrane protein 223 [Cephus cinctus]|uniref:Transmembrane protein 223 n=1 Tax=Cephus cinctus TaxID=211228 RepID=A0AAJ7BPU1_CEPCN|nr:transmembrane protein 223 [Cephus cinctus]
MISSVITRNICTIQKIGTQCQLFRKIIQCQSEKSGIFSSVITLPNSIRNYGLFNSISRLKIRVENNKIIPKPGNRQLSTKQVSSVERPYEVNTNVANNVILYKFEKDRFHKLLTIFGFSQLFGWLTISYYIYISYCKNLFETENWIDHVKENPVRFFLLVSSTMLGVLSYGVIHFLITRSIKYVILCKGGKQFMIATYHPIKQTTVKTIPIESVTLRTSRSEGKNVIALKIKGSPLYYLLDSQGVYTNPKLFDYTAGVKR